MTTQASTQVTNRIIRASAGTGKTFQLAHRFLSLLQTGAQADRILATTFTRKAAGEILERVVTRLADGALDESVCTELRTIIAAPELTREACLLHLTELLSRLYRLRISTLDSFFIQIAQSQSFELGLPAQWGIVDELADERMRDDALQLLFRGGRTSELVTLTNLITKGESSRSVGEIVRGTVKNLYSLYLETDAAAWHSLPKQKPLSDEELEATLAELEGVVLPANKFASGRDRDLERARQGAWDDFISKGIAAKVLNREEKYERQVISAELVSIYERLLDHARAVLIAQVSWQTEGSYLLLDTFHQLYHGLQQRRRLFRFNDVTRLLAEQSDRETSVEPQSAEQRADLDRTQSDVLDQSSSIEKATDSAVDAVNVSASMSIDSSVSQAATWSRSLEPLQRMAYRLDGAIDHLLLDEFQDTSPEQWRAVRRLAEHVCLGAEERSFFCVGDVKQAIYGWRGGVAEIFDVVENSLPGLDRQPLNRSYRSSQVIMDLVNRVFGSMTRHPNLSRGEAAVRVWSERFQTHEAAKTKLPGYACLQTGPRPQEKEKPASSQLDFAAAETARLRAASPGATIGVLVRKNVEVGGLISRLKRLHVPASGESGTPIVDAAGVQLLLSLLRLADHPGDTVSRFHLANSPLAATFDYRDPTADWATHELAQRVRQTLLQDGYGLSILRWSQPLLAIAGQRERRRLEQLVEQAYAYQQQATLRTADFIRFLEFQRVAEPASAAVRVMTIHQSKGLEFDIVVLPLLGKSLIGQAESFVVERSDPTRPAERVCRMVNQKIQQLFPDSLQAMFTAADERRVSEALCVLYVALTRAKHALHMLISPSAENERTLPNSYAGLLRVALRDAQPAGPNEIVFELGDPNWYQTVAVDMEPPVKESTGSIQADSKAPEVKTSIDSSRMQLPEDAAGRPGTLAKESVAARSVEGESSEAGQTAGSAASVSAIGRDAVVEAIRGDESSRVAGENVRGLVAGEFPGIRLAPSRGGRLRGWERVSPSSLEGDSRVKIGQVLRSQTNSEVMLRGTIMHVWFEQIRWLDEAFPSDELFLEMARRVVAAQSVNIDFSIPGLLAEFHRSLRVPELASVLTKSDYVRQCESRDAAWLPATAQPLCWTVQSERPFAIREEGRLLSGSIDRFVSVAAGDQLLGAEIIDFKTDEFTADDLKTRDRRIAFYRPQIEAYRRAMASVTALPIERITARLLFVRAGLSCVI
jgi:ATP-dependent exoDNAse (exonuclease V) beta subunit